MPSALTLSAAIAKFLAWAERHLRQRTVVEYRRYLTRFARHLGELPCSELRAYHLVDWGSTWHRIQAVQRCFNWLVEVEYLEKSPFNRVKRPRPGRRKRIFTRHEFLRMCRRASPDFRAFLLALRETIARPQEVRALRWSDLETCDQSKSIDFALANGLAYFALHDYKSRERRADPDALRIIPVSRRLGRLMLRIRAAGARGGEVFRSRRGTPWTKEATRLRLARLRRSLNLGKDARGEMLVCYSVRHTSATQACVRGIRDRLLADIMGHSNTRTTARYLHPEPRHLLEAIAAASSPKRSASTE